MANITITEEFDDALGQPKNYDMYDATYRDQLLGNRHVDIRSLVTHDIAVPIDMMQLDASYTISSLDSNTMSSLSDVYAATSVIFPGEAWTGTPNGVGVDPDPTRHNVPILTINCTANVLQTCSSFTRTPSNSNLSLKAEVNLQTLLDTDPGATLCISMPSFPGTVNKSASYFEMTSDSGGSYTSGAVSMPLVSGFYGGDYFEWPLSVLTDPNYNTATPIDPSSIKGVRFRINNTASTPVYVAAIRALGSDWHPSFVGDWDTRYQRYRRTVTRSGGVATGAIPMFRAADPASQDHDPRPIDVKLTCAFQAGGLTESSSFVFYLRERGEDFQTQLDLETFTQSGIETTFPNKQPDYGQALLNSRTQASLEAFGQSGLDTQTQTQLEATVDTVSQAYIQVNLTWDSTATTIAIKDTETPAGGEYVKQVGALSPATANNENHATYLLSLTLEGTTMNVKLEGIDQHGTSTGEIVINDTISDDSMFRRRRGRVGWNLYPADGRIYVEGIRTAMTVFGEYQSLPLKSFTAVDGIELFASSTPNTELVQGLDPGPYGGTVAPDVSRSNSDDGAFKVTVGAKPLQGVATVPFLIDNFEETSIAFDLYYPQTNLDQGASLTALLLGEKQQVIELVVPQILGDHWQTIRFTGISNNNEQTGNYRLVIWQPEPISATWWLDNVSVQSRSLAWSGRTSRFDDWLPFIDAYNSDRTGLKLQTKGFETQVRGRALRQDATIERLSFKPRYASLGRLVWPTTKAVAAISGVDSVTTSISGATVSFNGTTVAVNGDYVIDWLWNFGDGTFAHGPRAVHTYAASGTYPATLTVTGNYGDRRVVAVGVSV
jgi:PKD repeat protein